MAYARKRRATTRRRARPAKRVRRVRTYRRRRGGRRAMAIPRAPFPNSRTLRLTYCEQFDFASTGGVVAKYLFRANGMYDTNVTGTGHQPIGHDQIALLYNHYVVLRSKIDVTFYPVASVNAHPVIVGVRLGANQTFTDSALEIVERSQYNKASLGKTCYRICKMTDNQPVSARCRLGYNAKKFFNVADVKDNITRIGATFGSDPADQAYFIVFLQSINGVTDTSTVRVLAKITFIVSCSEPHTISTS